MGDAVPEAQLVEATMRGDAVAYAALYERHAGAVRTAVRGHISSDPDAVEDCVQEAFTRALAKIESLRDPDRFRPWLLQVARNVATDVGRGNAKADHEPIDEAGGEGITLRADTPDPGLVVELRDLAQLVRGTVAGLSARDATAISMVLWMGFGPQDIGAALGISTGAAKVMLHRARRRLRDALLLQLAAATRSFGCAELGGLMAADDELGAGRHLKDCAECVSSGREHFELDRANIL